MKQLNTIAIDLAKNIFQVCVLSPQQKVLDEKRLSRSQLMAFMATQQISIVAMEACYSSHYWGRTFSDMGHTVRIIPAQHVKPFVRGNKNDRNDALAIAEASARPYIRCVPIKTIEQQDIQALHRIRDKLVARRTSIINQTRGLLVDYGVFIQKGIKAFTAEITTLCDPDETRVSSIMKHQLTCVFDDFKLLTRRISDIETELKRYSQANDYCRHLQTIPGVGVINATALYSSIGNAQQFSKPRELSVWLGLTPRQYASGEKSFQTGITKRGNPYLRKQLIHGARALVSRIKDKQDKLSRWIRQLIERRGIQKAIVATASRLARIAWILLHRNEDYRAA